MNEPKVMIGEIIDAKIKDLKAHPKNRNRHPKEQIERLAQILKYQGFRYPVKVSNQSGFVTSGHGRIEAALLNGWDTVPVSYQDYDSEEQEYADVQADNAVASWSELDLSAINADIGELGPDFNLDMLGIKQFSLDPSFEVGSIDDQSKLDEKKIVIMECPHCKESFEQSQAKIIG